MILKFIYFIKHFKPAFKWRVPYLIAVCTIPTISMTHFSIIDYGMKTGVTIGFFSQYQLFVMHVIKYLWNTG